MAPLAPGKRDSIRKKVNRSGPGLADRKQTFTPSAAFGTAVTDDFLNTKKDKRLIKHSSFVNRIEKANKKVLKRRRPGKKLITTLESLANALPDLDMDGETRVEIGDAKIKHKSVRTRPGAQKRREKLEKMERERFGKNMAQLTTAVPAVAPAAEAPAAEAGAAAPAPTASRWEALRGFISQTMEQKPEFVKK